MRLNLIIIGNFVIYEKDSRIDFMPSQVKLKNVYILSPFSMTCKYTGFIMT